MGLSNQERIRNIISIVNELTNIKPFTGYLSDEQTQINKIIEDLWFDLLGTKSNSAHWFLGSSSDKNTLAEDDVFGLAMIGSFATSQTEKSNNEFVVSNFLQGEDKDWAKYCEQFKPTAISLLKKLANSQSHLVYEIFKLSENYFYSVNRYDDDLSKSFINLTKNITKLVGLCFKIMSNDPEYFKAYASDIVLNEILSSNIDDINKWVMNNNLHHNISIDLIDTQDLYNAFKQAQLAAHNHDLKFSGEERVILLLKFMGRRFHYEHVQKILLKMIEEHNGKFLNDVINITKITSLLDVANKQYESNNKEGVDSYFWHCDLTRQSSYDTKKEFKALKKKRNVKSKI